MARILYLLAHNCTSAPLAAARAAEDATLTVTNGYPLGDTWPRNAVIVRADEVLTALIISGRSGNVLTVSGPVTGYTDVDMAIGDALTLEPTGGTVGSVLAYTMFQPVGSGSLALPVLADDDAPSPSIFLGSDHLDTDSEPFLCRKNAAGNVYIITDAAPE